MKVIYKGSELNEAERQQVWEILCQCDNEFYPPLSARESSSQKTLNMSVDAAQAPAKPKSYFKEMILQDFLLAYEGDEVVGFMTFKRDYSCDALREFGKSLYITTVCVKESCRGRGIMNALYDHMEQEVPAVCGCKKISTRTWSLNQPQLHALPARGYRQLAVLVNDRGNGVDTIYFGMDLQDE